MRQGAANGDTVADVTVQDDELSRGHVCEISHQAPAGALRLDDDTQRLLVQNSDVIDVNLRVWIDVSIECRDVDTPSLKLEKKFILSVSTGSIGRPVIACSPTIIPEDFPTGRTVCTAYVIDSADDSVLSPLTYSMTLEPQAAPGLALRRVPSQQVAVDEIYVSNSSLLSHEQRSVVLVPINVMFSTDSTTPDFTGLVFIHVSKSNFFHVEAIEIENYDVITMLFLHKGQKHFAGTFNVALKSPKK